MKFDTDKIKFEINTIGRKSRQSKNVTLNDITMNKILQESHIKQ